MLPNQFFWIAILAASVAMPLFVAAQPSPTPPAATADPQDPTNRWSETAYGISLTPPPGTMQWDGPSTLWASPQGYTVGFELITSEVPFNLEQVAASVMVQMGFARSFPRLVADEQGQPVQPRPERIAERPGIQMFFDVTGDDGREWLYGQAVVMLEPHAAAVLKVQSPAETASQARAAFAQTLASLHVPLATELDRQRGALIEAGEAWLQTLTPESLKAAAPASQTYRIQQGDRELGYLQLGSTADPDILQRRGYEPAGLLFRQVRREYLDDRMLDTEQEAYASDDGRREVWSHKSTVRPSDQRPAAAGLPRDTPAREAITWSQTGVRGDQELRGRTVNAITVISEAPPASAAADQIRQHERFLGQRQKLGLKGLPQVKEWARPDKGYLPQITDALLPMLLPAAEADYAFTAYHAPSGEPTLRTVSVRTTPEGHKLVVDHPTPRSSPIRHVFDHQNRHLYTLYPSGVTLRPATAEELAEAWGQRPPAP